MDRLQKIIEQALLTNQKEVRVSVKADSLSTFLLAALLYNRLKDEWNIIITDRSEEIFTLIAKMDESLKTEPFKKND